MWNYIFSRINNVYEHIHYIINRIIILRKQICYQFITAFSYLCPHENLNVKIL